FAYTSKSENHVTMYSWKTLEEMQLPKGCQLVGVELDDNAVELPKFRHPLCAAYLLGPEKGDLSDAAKARCAHIVKIPTRFCVNLSVAAALVMYDRTLALGGFPPRERMAEGAPPTLTGRPRRLP
ncbi:MAG: TrmH family RNA methyltransferase, partial [Amphiplicatus sp.]